MVLEIKGGKVQIDEEDYELVSKYRWWVSDTGYAVWRGKIDGKIATVRMHRIIANTPADMITDHINHDRLDNRRSNLRVCTQSENARNLRDQGKGYWRHKQTGRWVVEIWGKHIGCFTTENEAIEVARLVRSGGTYTKPERTTCKHGHVLAETGYYEYGKTKLCKVCQSQRSSKYYRRKHTPHPRKLVTVCPRGHDKTLTRTKNGDCSECAKIRTKANREARYGRN